MVSTFVMRIIIGKLSMDLWKYFCCLSESISRNWLLKVRSMKRRILLILKIKHCMNTTISVPIHRFDYIYKACLCPPRSRYPPPSYLLPPNKQLLSTRLTDACIVAFSEIFTYTGSGNRGKMMEGLLASLNEGMILMVLRMFLASTLDKDIKNRMAKNVCAVLWCVADV